MKFIPITFDYEDFNLTTRRDTDCRKHGMAELHTTCEGVYIVGVLGCGKIKKDIGDALKEYLGGRVLLAYRIFN